MRYVEWMRETVSPAECRLIRKAIQRGQLTGGKKFIAEIARQAGMRIELRGPGRPRKKR